MKLVIVESPTKARTIGRFLGKDFEIKASMGHVKDLPKSKLGIDIEHGFEPEFEIVAEKKKIISELKEASRNAETILLATDPDREGEAIASHIAQLIANSKLQMEDKGKKSRKPSAISHKPVRRIVFHEITKEAIEEALKNPRDIDRDLVEAQAARRVLDRLVGYKLSPLLWKKIRRGLSAGRVQSVALRLIVEREREIEKFKKEKYFTISSKLRKEREEPVEFELFEINGEKVEKVNKISLYDGQYQYSTTSLANEEMARKIIEDLKNSKFVVSSVDKKQIKRSPQPPYITSTLQQDASRKLGYSGKRTMSLAQKLYEEGYITYHRTDSFSVSASAVSSTREFIKKEYGQKYVPQSPRFYKTKQKSAQEAHEAIRPTNVGELQSQIGGAEAKLYELIWRKAVASQMADAITESTAVIVKTDSNYTFKANGSVLVFDGFLKANPSGLGDKKLPMYKTGDVLSHERSSHQEHETAPPPRYNDASLIKTLDEKDIGRPSTYATIIGTIEARAYIEREEGKFIPTPVGVAVNDFLVKNFPGVDDIPFTAEMENDLDSIARGEKEWRPVIGDFYGPFEKELAAAEKSERVKIEAEEIDETCPQCGSKLVIRTGRFGKFISCSTFPDCKFTKPYAEITGMSCPKDGGQIIIKKTKKGRKFYGCSNYPKCDFAAWKLEDIRKKQPAQAA